MLVQITLAELTAHDRAAVRWGHELVATIVGVSTSLSEWTYIRVIAGVPIQFYYCLLMMLVIWYVATYTPLGARALFVGQSRDVAALSGITSDRIRWGAFVLAGVLAPLGGILYVGTTGSAGPSSVGAFLLPAYAAIFLGATSIQPAGSMRWAPAWPCSSSPPAWRGCSCWRAGLRPAALLRRRAGRRGHAVPLPAAGLRPVQRAALQHPAALDQL
jgi:hypothetical protein